MWISKEKYAKLWDRVVFLSKLAYATDDHELFVNEDGSVANRLTYKQLYEDSQRQKETIIKEKNRYKELAYKEYGTFSNLKPYKELYETQQKLASNLTQKVNALQSEIDNLKGFKTYVLESGEEVKAEKIYTNDNWIEFIKDGEVFKTVELQEWEIK